MHRLRSRARSCSWPPSSAALKSSKRWRSYSPARHWSRCSPWFARARPSIWSARLRLRASRPIRAVRYGAIPYNVLELLRWLGLMREPFIPSGRAQLRRQLGLPVGTDAAPESAERPAVRGALPHGTVIQKGNAVSSPGSDRSKELLDKRRAARLQAAAEKQSQQSAATTAAVPATPAAATATVPAEAAPLPEITIDEFKRLDLTHRQSAGRAKSAQKGSAAAKSSWIWCCWASVRSSLDWRSSAHRSS